MTEDDPQPQTDSAPDATSMSVDQLSQAFANLMADPEDSDAVDSAAKDDGESPAGTTPAVVEEDDDTSVNPESIVEAILFVGHPENQPLKARAVASYLRGVSPQEVDQIVADLNAIYAEEGAPYEIISEGAGYRMSLRGEFQRLRESFYGRVREAKLSQVAVDLLAIVAYHQPIGRADIEEVRGQPSGGVLNQLVRRQLIQVEYTEEKPRQKRYRTTDRFLDLFGLDSLEDLPSHDGPTP